MLDTYTKWVYNLELDVDATVAKSKSNPPGAVTPKRVNQTKGTTMLNQTIQTVKLDAESFAQIDTAHNLVTIHRGSRTGSDQDWGGQCVASLELDKALAIAEAVKALKIQEECDLFLQAEDEAIEAWAVRLDAQREASHDLVSENF